MNRFDEEMEIGTTGWVSIGNGSYRNIYNNHILDSDGREFDESGNIIYDPTGKDINDN